MRKLGPVIIDPRRHDAVLFDLDSVVAAEGSAPDSAVTLIRQLHEIGAGTAVFSDNRDRQDALDAAGIGDLIDVHVGGPAEAAGRLGARPGRCVVVANDAAAVTAGRDGGFALVVGVDRTGHRDALRRFGADAVVTDLGEVDRAHRGPTDVAASRRIAGARPGRRPHARGSRQCSSTSTAPCPTSSTIRTRPARPPVRPRRCRSWPRSVRSRCCPAATSPM